MESYPQGLFNGTCKCVLGFSVALLLIACSEERIEETRTISASQLNARAIAGCELAENAEVEAFLLVAEGRFLMTPSVNGESASATVTLSRGQSVSIEIVLRENDIERVIATASGTVPDSGNALNFMENQFVLTCDAGLVDDPTTDSEDLDGDGVPDILDEDADGDGLLDADDPFVDLNQDGFDDTSSMADNETPDISEANPCGTEDGVDNDSSNSDWGDNCTIRRTALSGQFADSLFTVGIQRILYCSGFGEGASYTDFADGEFGMATENAVQEFQISGPNVLVADGIVGPQTWAKLQSAIVLLEVGDFNGGGVMAQDTYGFASGRCANITLFYQTITIEEFGVVSGTVRGGWKLARNTPNEALSIPFSIDTPFDRL